MWNIRAIYRGWRGYYLDCPLELPPMVLVLWIGLLKTHCCCCQLDSMNDYDEWKCLNNMNFMEYKRAEVRSLRFSLYIFKSSTSNNTSGSLHDSRWWSRWLNWTASFRDDVRNDDLAFDIWLDWSFIWSLIAGLCLAAGFLICSWCILHIFMFAVSWTTNHHSCMTTCKARKKILLLK